MREKVTLEQKALDRYNSKVFFERRKVYKQDKYMRVIVVREYNRNGKRKGKVLAYRPQKGSKLRSRIEAQQIYYKTKTLYNDRWKVGRRIVKGKSITSVYKVGDYNNTYQIVSTAPVKEVGNYQFEAKIIWEVKGNPETTAYSKGTLNENVTRITSLRNEALNSAIGSGVTKKIISYEYDIQMISPERGVAIKGNSRIFFRVYYRVLSYIQNGKDTKPNKTKRKKISKSSRI